MTARVFVHPRCLTGPALGALAASLEERGVDMNLVRCVTYHEGSRTRYELCRVIGEEMNGWQMYDRMDGTRFRYRSGGAIAPVSPEAA